MNKRLLDKETNQPTYHPWSRLIGGSKYQNKLHTNMVEKKKERGEGVVWRIITINPEPTDYARILTWKTRNIQNLGSSTSAIDRVVFDRLVSTIPVDSLHTLSLIYPHSFSSHSFR